MVHGDISRRWSFTFLFFLTAVFVFTAPRLRAPMTSVSISTGWESNHTGPCGMSAQGSGNREVGYVRFGEGG